MIKRSTKAAYYAVAGPLMRANGLRYRLLKAPRASGQKAHLGPGQKNYLPGWVNVDANILSGKCDVWADLRHPLPFPDGSLEAVYSHHVIEHLPDLRAHMEDVFRCLMPGGVYRVGGPNGDSAIAKFVEGDLNWFGDFPDNRRSLGGRFENFIFCRQEHLTILTHSYLEELLTDAGFSEVRRCMPTRETMHPEIFEPCLALEWESDFTTPHTLLLEAVRPE